MRYAGVAGYVDTGRRCNSATTSATTKIASDLTFMTASTLKKPSGRAL
jgi:hypothetical protein